MSSEGTEQGDQSHRGANDRVLDYEQPSASPYTGEPILLLFGENQQRYTVPKPLVEKYQKLKDRIDYDDYNRRTPSLSLKGKTEDIAHTIVHYLYTGEYQTLEVEEEESRYEREYRRSVFVYCVAVGFDIHDLASKATQYIEHFGDAVDIYHILATAAWVFGKIPNGSWYSKYLERKITAVFAEDQNIFEREKYMKCVGKLLPLDKFLTRTMVSLYAGKISTLSGEIDRTRKAIDNDEGHDGPPPKRQCSEE